MGERGSLAMFIVVFLTILATIPMAMQMVQISNRRTTQQINISVQSDNVARAGLVEALSWFRRQATQPVRSSANPGLYSWADAAFHPRASTDTATADTLDEGIGLVKEYSLSDSDRIWGRFEVKRQPDTASNPVDAQAVHDISDKRIEGASAGEGLAWYVESTGIVYRRVDGGVPYNVAPNEVISRSRAATEIRRIAIVLPANAALCVNARNGVTLQNNSRVRGQTAAGIAYYTGGGPSVSGGSSYTGSPNSVDVGSGGINVQTLFGVSENELKLMADYTVSSVDELPDGYPSMAVVFIAGNAAFDTTRKLKGGGILYVDGNLTINSTTSDCLFSGLIFVSGNCTITGESLISGALVVQGTVTMNGSGGVAEVDYDGPILDSVRQQVAQYRENKAVFYSFSGTK